MRKTCAHVFIKPTLFFHILRAQKQKYLEKSTGVVPVMGVVTLNSVDSVTGVVPGRTFKNQTNNNALRPGSSPYAVEYSLTVTISGGPTISFVDWPDPLKCIRYKRAPNS